MNKTIEHVVTKEEKELKALRTRLHNAIVATVDKVFGLCSSTEIVEAFKREYLWVYWHVETSKALSADEIKKAIMALSVVKRNEAIRMIMKRNSKFRRDRDVIRCSPRQKSKIVAISHKLQLQMKALKTYATETLGRGDVWLFDISITEAHHLIERMEKWEAKKLQSTK